MLPTTDHKRLTKVDSGERAVAAKIDIRRRVFDAVKEAGPVAVLDVFAGGGEMHRAIWREADRYVGCDKRYFPDDCRELFAADNRRVLRAIDLADFNLFDLDAHGSPWHQATIVADRRKLKADERVGFVFTEGDGLSYKANNVAHAVTHLIGLRAANQVGLIKRRQDVLALIVGALAKRMGGRIAQRWQAMGKTGAAVAYLGVVLEGV